MRLPAPSMIPKCRALTRFRLIGGVLFCDVVDDVVASGEGNCTDAVACAGGASQNQSTSNTTTGTLQNMNEAFQASLPRNCTMTGTVAPAATASPMISPSLNNAVTRPICPGNQRRTSVGMAVWLIA